MKIHPGGKWICCLLPANKMCIRDRANGCADWNALGFMCQAVRQHIPLPVSYTHLRQLKPELVCIFHADRARELKKRLAGTGIKIVSGIEGLCACLLYTSINSTFSSELFTGPNYFAVLFDGESRDCLLYTSFLWTGGSCTACYGQKEA